MDAVDVNWCRDGSYAAFVSGIRCYFDRVFGSLLLYPAERKPYREHVVRIVRELCAAADVALQTEDNDEGMTSAAATSGKGSSEVTESDAEGESGRASASVTADEGEDSRSLAEAMTEDDRRQFRKGVVLRVSEFFGGIHLLRLIVKLPELFARSREATRTVRRSPAIINKMDELIAFLARNISEFFPSDYVAAKSEVQG